jgi:hypothetical protein
MVQPMVYVVFVVFWMQLVTQLQGFFSTPFTHRQYLLTNINATLAEDIVINQTIVQQHIARVLMAGQVYIAMSTCRNNRRAAHRCRRQQRPTTTMAHTAHNIRSLPLIMLRIALNLIIHILHIRLVVIVLIVLIS